MSKGQSTSAAQGIHETTDNLDKEGTPYAVGPFAYTDKNAGAKASAGVGRAGAAWSVFSVEANGPNASAEASANETEFGAMAGAELGSVSAAAGPVEAKLGLGVDTGVKISSDKIEAKVLGTGVTFGSTIGISFLGSEFKIKLW
ncbi:hypothetical protein KOW79_011066 [Hemibagrus wyckioides]|uniref:Uncharacterized protein n=1 Tax=Hemibagrus wyckioides TaxID=337641 RepID=A0A9D3NPI2_9TELE|nr:hypothetical protein KOW79_011066 [Hemibagrus wyckioides]